MKKQIINQFPHSADDLKNHLGHLAEQTAASVEWAWAQNRLNRATQELASEAQQRQSAISRIAVQLWKSEHPECNQEDEEIVKRALAFNNPGVRNNL